MKLSPRLLIAILAAVAATAIAVWWPFQPAPLRNEIEAGGRYDMHLAWWARDGRNSGTELFAGKLAA